MKTVITVKRDYRLLQVNSWNGNFVTTYHHPLIQTHTRARKRTHVHTMSHTAKVAHKSC